MSTLRERILHSQRRRNEKKEEDEGKWPLHGHLSRRNDLARSGSLPENAKHINVIVRVQFIKKFYFRLKRVRIFNYSLLEKLSNIININFSPARVLFLFFGSICGGRGRVASVFIVRFY